MWNEETGGAAACFTSDPMTTLVAAGHFSVVIGPVTPYIAAVLTSVDVPPHLRPATREEAQSSLDLSLRWAERSKAAFAVRALLRKQTLDEVNDGHDARIRGERDGGLCQMHLK